MMDIDTLLDRYEFIELKTNSHNKKKVFEFSVKNYCFLDIETSKTDNSTECSEAISFSMCDYNNTFALCSKYVTTQEQMYKEMLELVHYFTNEKQKKLRCYYHNLTFDCTFLLIELNKLGYIQVDTIDSKSIDNDTKEYTLIVSNNQIIQLEYTYKSKVFQIWDTFKIWATGLRTVSKECVKLNKKAIENKQNIPFLNILDKEQDTNFNYIKMRKIGERYSKEDIQYCVNDVVSSSAIIKLFSFLDIRMTISSMAYNTCMNSFIDSLYIHDSICFMLQAMLINNSLDINNLSSLVHSERNENGYNIYSKNYYEQYDNNTLIGSIEFSNLKNKEKTTLKTLYKDNFSIIKSLIIDKVFQMKFTDLHEKIEKMSLFYEYKRKDFKSLYSFLMYYFTFAHGGNVKTSSQHFIDVSKDLEKFKDAYFPSLSYKLDTYLRNAYEGGICQVNPIYQYTEVYNVKHIDINSSYPHKARDCQLPVGQPKFVRGYVEKTGDTICLYKFVCNYDIKKGYLPVVLSKNRFGMAKMSTHDTIMNMLKNTDTNKRFLYMYDRQFELFKKCYNITNLTVIETVVFKAKKGVLYAFNDKYYKLKQSKKGTALYIPSKIILNSVTGKFGQNKYRMEKYKTLANFDKGIVHFEQVENTEYNEKEIKSYYLPIVSYITALARCQLMEGCNTIIENGGKIYYMDTDSIFFSADKVNISDNKCLTINNNETNILIDKNILGAWDMEHDNISKAIFICPKRYFLDIDGREVVKDVKCAGVSRQYAKNITFENFKLGNKFDTLHRKKTEKGVDLINDVKEMRYSEILYKCDICTLSTTEIYKIGDKARNIYGDICTIQDILYCPPKFRKEVEQYYDF